MTELELKTSFAQSTCLNLVVGFTLWDCVSFFPPVNVDVLTDQCDRYEEKRWVVRDGRSPYDAGEEKMSFHQSRPEEKNIYINKAVNSFDERKTTLPSGTSRDAASGGRISIPSPPKGLEQVQLLLWSILFVFCLFFLFLVGKCSLVTSSFLMIVNFTNLSSLGYY